MLNSTNNRIRKTVELVALFTLIIMAAAGEASAQIFFDETRFGLRHQALGSAEMCDSCNNALVINNIGSSGLDGVKIDLPDVEAVSFTSRGIGGNVDLASTQKVAYLGTAVQPADALNGLLCYSMIMAGPLGDTLGFPDTAVTKFFPGSQPFSGTVSATAYMNGAPVGSFFDIDYFAFNYNNLPGPIRTTGPTLDYMPDGETLRIGCGFDFGGPVSITIDSENVTVDMITFELVGSDYEILNVDEARVTGSNLAEIRIYDETFAKFGNGHKILGNSKAVKDPGIWADGALDIANIGSSGEDGVRFFKNPMCFPLGLNSLGSSLAIDADFEYLASSPNASVTYIATVSNAIGQKRQLPVTNFVQNGARSAMPYTISFDGPDQSYLVSLYNGTQLTGERTIQTVLDVVGVPMKPDQYRAVSYCPDDTCYYLNSSSIEYLWPTTIPMVVGGYTYDGVNRLVVTSTDPSLNGFDKVEHVDVLLTDVERYTILNETDTPAPLQAPFRAFGRWVRPTGTFDWEWDGAAWLRGSGGGQLHDGVWIDSYNARSIDIVGNIWRMDTEILQLTAYGTAGSSEILPLMKLSVQSALGGNGLRFNPQWEGIASHLAQVEVYDGSDLVHTEIINLTLDPIILRCNEWSDTMFCPPPVTSMVRVPTSADPSGRTLVPGMALKVASGAEFSVNGTAVQGTRIVLYPYEDMWVADSDIRMTGLRIGGVGDDTVSIKDIFVRNGNVPVAPFGDAQLDIDSNDVLTVSNPSGSAEYGIVTDSSNEIGYYQIDYDVYSTLAPPAGSYLETRLMGNGNSPLLTSTVSIVDGLDFFLWADNFGSSPDSVFVYNGETLVYSGPYAPVTSSDAPSSNTVSIQDLTELVWLTEFHFQAIPPVFYVGNDRSGITGDRVRFTGTDHFGFEAYKAQVAIGGMDSVKITSMSVEYAETSCCAQRGDFDHSGTVDISDLTGQIAYIFSGGAGPVCDEEGDFNGDGAIDISDVTSTVAYLFAGGDAPASCGSAPVGKAGRHSADLKLWAEYDGTETAIYSSSDAPLSGVQVRLADGQALSASLSATSSLDLMSGLVDNARMVGLADLNGPERINAGQNELFRIEGKVEIAEAVVSDNNHNSVVPVILAARDADGTQPDEFEADPSYPNPFNPTTTIGFNLPKATDVILKVYNVMGQLVTTLVDERLGAGRHEVTWDASANASGMYFYKIQADDFKETHKMMLLK